MQFHNQSSHSGVKRRWACLIDVVGVRPQTTVCTRAAIALNRTDDAEDGDDLQGGTMVNNIEISVVFH